MKFSLVLVALAIAMVSSPAPAQDRAGAKDEMNRRVQQFMSTEVSFEDMVPPGMSIEAKEVSRKGVSGNGLEVQYHIFVKGVPPGILLGQVSWPVNADKPSVVMGGISVGKDGVLMCAGRTDEQCGDANIPDDPIEFTMMPAKGEPYRFAFVAGDLKIGLVIVPDPIEAKDKGCTLSAVRLTSGFELAFLSGSGYTPNSDIHYRVDSDKKVDLVVHSTADGKIRVSFIPDLRKGTGGKVKVKVTDPACSPDLTYNWGKGS